MPLDFSPKPAPTVQINEAKPWRSLPLQAEQRTSGSGGRRMPSRQELPERTVRPSGSLSIPRLGCLLGFRILCITASNSSGIMGAGATDQF